MSALALSLFLLGSLATQTAHGMVRVDDDVQNIVNHGMGADDDEAQNIVDHDILNRVNMLGQLDVDNLERCIDIANKFTPNTHQPDDLYEDD